MCLFKPFSKCITEELSHSIPEIAHFLKYPACTTLINIFITHVFKYYYRYITEDRSHTFLEIILLSKWLALNMHITLVNICVFKHFSKCITEWQTHPFIKKILSSSQNEAILINIIITSHEHFLEQLNQPGFSLSCI